MIHSTKKHSLSLTRHILPVRPHQINLLVDGPDRTSILKIGILILFLKFPPSASGNEILSISRIRFCCYNFFFKRSPKRFDRWRFHKEKKLLPLPPSDKRLFFNDNVGCFDDYSAGKSLQIICDLSSECVFEAAQQIVLRQMRNHQQKTS